MYSTYYRTHTYKYVHLGTNDSLITFPGMSMLSRNMHNFDRSCNMALPNSTRPDDPREMCVREKEIDRQMRETATKRGMSLCTLQHFCLASGFGPHFFPSVFLWWRERCSRKEGGSLRWDGSGYVCVCVAPPPSLT